MSTEQKQAVLDAYAEAGFAMYDASKNKSISVAITAMLVQAMQDDGDAGKAFVIDQKKYPETNLPNDICMLVHAVHNTGLPATLDDAVIVAIWPVEGYPPIEMEATSSYVVFALIKSLHESSGNLNKAITDARAAGDAHNASVQAESQDARNENEAAVIAEYAKYGYVVKSKGRKMRFLQKDFPGGWHAVTVPTEDQTGGDLPQSLDEEVEAALHVHHTGATAVATAQNSHDAIRAAEQAIAVHAEEKTKADARSARKNRGAMVS